MNVSGFTHLYSSGMGSRDAAAEGDVGQICIDASGVFINSSVPLFHVDCVASFADFTIVDPTSDNTGPVIFKPNEGGSGGINGGVWQGTDDVTYTFQGPAGISGDYRSASWRYKMSKATGSTRGVGSFHFGGADSTASCYYKFKRGIPSERAYNVSGQHGAIVAADGLGALAWNADANYKISTENIVDGNTGTGDNERYADATYRYAAGTIIPFAYTNDAVEYTDMTEPQWMVFIDLVSSYNTEYADDGVASDTAIEVHKGLDLIDRYIGSVPVVDASTKLWDFDDAWGWDPKLLIGWRGHLNEMLDAAEAIGEDNGNGIDIAAPLSIVPAYDLTNSARNIDGESSKVTVGTRGDATKLNYTNKTGGVDYHQYTQPINFNNPQDDGQKGQGQLASNYVILDIRDHLVDYGVQMWISDGGEFYSGHGLKFNQDSDTVGTATAKGFVGGSIVLESDRRLKHSIESLDTEIEALALMRGVSYKFNDRGGDKAFSKQLKYGVVAQEVQEHMPHIVNTDNEYLSVDYIQLTAFIPQLYQKIVALEKEIKELKKE